MTDTPACRGDNVTLDGVLAAPDPPPARVTDSAALALDYADRLVLAAVRDVHQSVARRVFSATRVVGGGVPERIHRSVSTASYSGLSTAMRGSATGLRALARRGIGAPLESTPSGRQLSSAVNALIGAELAQTGDPAHIRMALRRDAADVPLEPAALAQAYPAATGKVVLLLHGLGENDESWRLRVAERGGAYADRIADGTDWTPLVLRYNTGLHVSDNGAELANFITGLTERWPVPITSIAFVGHSMGGLLARSTTVQAYATRKEWVDRVTHVVCLGTPHLGAQLEKVVHLGARALAWMPESAPFGTILDTRSPGIVDLRHGYVTRDEWEGHDLTARWGQNRIAVAPLPQARYHFVAATLGRDPHRLTSRVLGDLLVRFSSASGRGRQGEPVCDPAEVEHLGSTGHFALLNHPRIAAWLVEWLQRAPDGVQPA